MPATLLAAASLYGATLVIFLALDAAMLSLAMKPLFERHIGPLMAETPRWGVAGAFYLFYIGGILWFASWPALQSGEPGAWRAAFRDGAILGFLAYGTYEATNMALLKGWSFSMLAADVAWGTVLTGLCAALGLAVVQALGVGASGS